MRFLLLGEYGFRKEKRHKKTPFQKEGVQYYHREGFLRLCLGLIDQDLPFVV